MKTVDNNEKYRQQRLSNKRTVASIENGNVEMKMIIAKEIIKQLIHTGYNISEAAPKAGITRQQVYNYMNDDLAFAQAIRAGEKTKNQITASMVIQDKIDDGDYLAARNYLKDTKYYETRVDISNIDATSSVKKLEKGDDGVYRLPTDINEVAKGILSNVGADYLEHMEFEGDVIMKSLAMRDLETSKRMEEIRSNKNKEDVSS